MEMYKATKGFDEIVLDCRTLPQSSVPPPPARISAAREKTSMRTTLKEMPPLLRSSLDSVLSERMVGLSVIALGLAAFSLAGGATMMVLALTLEKESLKLSSLYGIPTLPIGAFLTSLSVLVVLIVIARYVVYRTL